MQDNVDPQAGVHHGVRLRSLKICLLGYRNNPFSGGQGIYIRQLSKALVDAGHSVDVIAGEPYPQLDPRVRLIPLPGLNLFASANHVTALRPRHLLSFTDFFEWLSMLTGGFPEPYTFGRRLVKYFARSRPDYDIIHDNQSLCYGLLHLQRQGWPVIATIHHPITRDRDIAVQAAADWKLRLLVKRWHHFLFMQQRVSQRLNHLVTVSDMARKDIALDFDIPMEKIHRVHNGIDTQCFHPIENICKAKGMLLTTASADSPLKGLKFLLQALPLVRDRLPHIRLTVIGSPSKDSPTEAIIRRENLSEIVTFIKGISAEELNRLYNEATLVIAPSLYEGFGFPAGEAMAAGTAVIATNGGALPEVVGDAGVIVEKGDSRQLADAIVTLLQNDHQRHYLEKIGRERVLSLFNWPKVAREMTQIYERMLETESEHVA
ncbi:MAG: glycosyltransferase family 4 protein [Gammaproteobacteria bacterium]|nr:glycosyltransferase family 4 protein [Gammaproteobacteria bacterium]